MTLNALIDAHANAQTVAFYKQLYSLWNSGKHVSAAWISQPQVNQAAQPEWNYYKKTTGKTPAMCCLNSSVIANEIGQVLTQYGVTEYVAPGCLPFLKALGGKLGAVQITGPGWASQCPALYANGTTVNSSLGPTTVAAINAAGTLPITATTGWTAGARGVIACSDGLHPFSYVYNGTNTLQSVVVAVLPASNANGNVDQTQGGLNSDGHLSAVATSAVVNPLGLATGNANVLPAAGQVNGSNYSSEFWPLHWDANAWNVLSAAGTTGGDITGATSAGWLDAQAVNANGNLNTELDQIAAFAAAIAPTPLIVRLMPESNNGLGAAAFWYDPSNFSNSGQQGSQLFRYCAAYLIGDQTGAVGFGSYLGHNPQPVCANPVHNIIFAVNSAVGGLGTIGVDYPTALNAPWTSHVADLMGLDCYSATWGATAPEATFSTMAAVSGYSGNVPPLLMEAYTNTGPHFDPYSCMQVFSGTNGTSGDLHGLTGTNVISTASNYNSTRAFGTSGGTIAIACKNGVQYLTYSGNPTVTGSNPSKVAKFTITGNPSPPGSIVDNPVFVGALNTGLLVGTPATASPAATPAQFLTGVKNATLGGCHFCVNPVYYGGLTLDENALLFQPGAPAVFNDPATVNLPTPGRASWSQFGWGAGQGTEWGGWQTLPIGV